MGSKVLTDYLADMRLDLKDSGTLWSDAELTRCIERAVSDLSRFLPRERDCEMTIDLSISESFTTPAATDTDYFVDNKDISASVAGNTCTLAHSAPDLPRPIIVTVTDANASITVITLIVKGRDADGSYQEEYFYISGGLVQTGKKYFSLISEVEIDEITGNGAGDALDVGTGDNVGVWVELANHPIKFQSESISGYVLDTDYEMDYTGGKIRKKTDGSMAAAATAYTITYTKSETSFTLDSIPDIVRLERIEYPAGGVPQTFAKYTVWNNVVTILGSEQESQSAYSDAQHLVIQYLTKHMPPTTAVPGTYPDFLDWTVELAADAYALFMKAIQYEHAAITDLTEMKTTLGYLGIGTGSPSLVYKAIEDALAKVATYLESNGTTDNAKDVLANITDDATRLRDYILTPATTAPTAGDLFKSFEALGKVAVVDLDAATVGSGAWLLEGELLINAVNTGAQVPENYANFARAKIDTGLARVQTAAVYVQEANTILSMLRSYIEEAGGWQRMGEDFVAEAQGRVAEAQSILAEAAQYQQSVQSNLVIAEQFRTEAIERRNEAWAIWSDPKQFAPMYSLGQGNQPAT